MLRSVITCIYVGIFVIYQEGSHALNVFINPPVTTTIGKKDVDLICYFEKSEGEIVDNPTFTIEVNNNTSDEYESIAVFLINGKPRLTPSGQYLINRVTLDVSSSNATLSFDEIKCEDDASYVCRFAYIDIKGDQKIVYSESTSINITSSTKRPFNLTSYPALDALLEYDNVTFKCTGNVGNPPDNLIWMHYRQDSLFTAYSDAFTSLTKNLSDCSYVGISELNLTMTYLDDKAVIGCAVNFSTRVSGEIIKTRPINVFYTVRDIVIERYPSQDVYESDPDNYVNMSCTSNGNPPATYVWKEIKTYEETTMNANTSMLSLQLTVYNSGTYKCVAYNSFNNRTYNVSTRPVNLTIVDKEEENSQTIPVTKARINYVSPSTSTSGGSIVRKSSIAILCLLAVLVVAAVCYRRRKKTSVRRLPDTDILHDTSLNTNNDDNVEDVQLAAAYASVQDASKILENRRPAETNQYADILEVSNRKKNINGGNDIQPMIMEQYTNANPFQEKDQIKLTTETAEYATVAEKRSEDKMLTLASDENKLGQTITNESSKL